MFDFIRNNRRFLQFVLLIMILPSFVFFGIQGYNRVGAGDSLASIGQQNVSQAELDQAMREQLERIKQQFGQQIDVSMFDTPASRQAMLDRLINQKVVALEAQKSNLSASDDKLREVIANIPGVAVDGKVDEEQYKRVAAAQGLSIEGFQSRVRSDIATQQVSSGLTSSSFVPTALLNSLLQEQSRTRTVQALSFNAQNYTQQVKLDPSAVKAYYESNKSKFEVQERAKIEYVAFDSNSIAHGIVVSAEDLKSYYENNKARFGTPEERKASHILIKTDASASAAAIETAKVKAAEIEAKLRKDPSQFAKLATSNSDDTGSKSQGGDLGFFKREMMTKPFSDAVFSMKLNEISQPIKTEFGWHVIQVTGVKAANIKPLAEVSKELEAEIKSQQASKKFAELSEQFSNLVYEQGDSYKGVAEKFKLTVKTQDGMTRAAMNAPKQPGVDAMFNEKLAAALFSEDSIKSRKNTEAIEVSKGRLVSARLLDYSPNKTLPLEEVKSAVEAQVMQVEAAKIAKSEGEAKLKTLQADPSLDVKGLEASKTFSRAKPEGIPTTAIKAISKADTSKLPTWVGVELPGGAYTLYKITAVSNPAALDDAQKKQLESTAKRAISESEVLAALSTLRDRHGVKIIKQPAMDTVKSN